MVSDVNKVATIASFLHLLHHRYHHRHRPLHNTPSCFSPRHIRVHSPVRPSRPDSSHLLLVCFDPGLRFLPSFISGIEVWMHTARIARRCSGGGFVAEDAASRSPPEVADDSAIIELIADLVCELANSAQLVSRRQCYNEE